MRENRRPELVIQNQGHPVSNLMQGSRKITSRSRKSNQVAWDWKGICPVVIYDKLMMMMIKLSQFQYCTFGLNPIQSCKHPNPSNYEIILRSYIYIYIYIYYIFFVNDLDLELDNFLIKLLKLL